MSDLISILGGVLGLIFMLLYLFRMKKSKKEFELKNDVSALVYCVVVAYGMVGGLFMFLSSFIPFFKNAIANISLYSAIGGIASLVISSHSLKKQILDPSESQDALKVESPQKKKRQRSAKQKTDA